MHPYRTILHLLALTIIFSCFAGYSFMNAAWTPPPAAPPTSNTEAPVNVGTTDQVKNGGLSVDALSVTGNTNVTGTSTITGIYGLNVTSAGPRIKMTNTTVGSTDWWLHNSGSSFYLIADRDGNGNWTTPAENPWPMQVVASTTSTGDFVSFSNKVRANEYCERNGGNCFAAADVNAVITAGTTVPPASAFFSFFANPNSSSPIAVTVPSSPVDRILVVEASHHSGGVRVSGATYFVGGGQNAGGVGYIAAGAVVTVVASGRSTYPSLSFHTFPAR